MQDFEPLEKLIFLAVLVYESGEEGCCEVPRTYCVSHPEIAYRLAMNDGQEERYGNKFVGISVLEMTEEIVEPIARDSRGDPHRLIVPKSDLPIFREPRWQDVPWDEDELNEMLAEPPVMFELAGIDEIPWQEFTHAYGPATDVPKDLDRLSSSDAQLRENAIWQLSGSIYHQGDVYSATAIAIPFLIEILAIREHPLRSEVLSLLSAIADSACTHPQITRRNYAALWKDIYERHGTYSPEQFAEMVETTIQSRSGCHEALYASLPRLRGLRDDSDNAFCKGVSEMVAMLEEPMGSFAKCTYCKGNGLCFCKRIGSERHVCRRCSGTGVCHVCSGTGNLPDTP